MRIQPFPQETIDYADPPSGAMPLDPVISDT
jgi:hypothetical protein